MLSLDKSRLRALYVLMFLGSGCGFMVQTLVSGFWATAFSDDVFIFSINLAFYFLSMGLGSLLTQKMGPATLRGFSLVVTGLCVWTGLAIPVLRAGIAAFGENLVLPIAIVSVAGILSGVLLPLGTRIPDLQSKVRLGTLLLMDYAAAIPFTLVFTFLLLIPLGYTRTGLTVGYFCLACLFFCVLLAKVPKVGGVWVSAALLLAAGFYKPKVLAIQSIDGHSDARIVYKEQSHFQKIVLTEESSQDPLMPHAKIHTLYLDGFVQFSTLDEQIYHACLVNVPMAALESVGVTVKRVLVLGGGDGLAIRNLLPSKTVEKITLVELDPSMLRMAKFHPILQRYNLKALDDRRVEVLSRDAFKWARDNQSGLQYDLVILDFPLPKNISLARLFTAEFYRAVLSLMTPEGFMAIQAGPSYDHDDPSFMTVSRVTASVVKTLESLGASAHIYTTYPDNEAFVLGTRHPGFQMPVFAKSIGISSEHGKPGFCSYNSQWKLPSNVQVNSLNYLPIAEYMVDWLRKKGGKFFSFVGNRAVFLPD